MLPRNQERIIKYGTSGEQESIENGSLNCLHYIPTIICGLRVMVTEAPVITRLKDARVFRVPRG